MQCSRALVLENMVDAADVDSELEAEVMDECSKFGRVLRVTVSISPTDNQDSYELPADDDVKIFVEFSLPSGVGELTILFWVMIRIEH